MATPAPAAAGIARTPTFFRITVGLLVASVLAGVVAALVLVHEAGNINRAGGWGWIMVGAIFVAATTAVCLACAVCTAISLKRRESHRQASIVILVISCLVVLAFGPAVVQTVASVLRQQEEEARVPKVTPGASADSLGRSTIPESLVLHFRLQGLHLRPQGRFPNRETEWILENAGVGSRCEVVVSFAQFWTGASVEAIQKQLMAVSTPSVLNEHVKMAMFYPHARGTTSDVKDCEEWPARSEGVIKQLHGAFSSYQATSPGQRAKRGQGKPGSPQPE